MIPRFYDVTGGELRIDGVNIKKVPQKELRAKIGFVPQKGMLFSGTIASNIKYGKPNITDEQMKLASSIAQAEEFIKAKEEQYNSPIYREGKNNVYRSQEPLPSTQKFLCLMIVFQHLI